MHREQLPVFWLGTCSSLLALFDPLRLCAFTEIVLLVPGRVTMPPEQASAAISLAPLPFPFLRISPAGPTQEGQPVGQGHSEISLCVFSSNESLKRKSGSLSPRLRGRNRRDRCWARRSFAPRCACPVSVRCSQDRGSLRDLQFRILAHGGSQITSVAHDTAAWQSPRARSQGHSPRRAARWSCKAAPPSWGAAASAKTPWCAFPARAG